ncbi:alpha/beta fold hydrolase, partial [Poseidonocella sp. HB161398]|uniref:alpha/beta fold hydrolase n=1 Tax=Poseidonocella sp. HB161398 TaxID=2320855 RepID=UPI0011080DBF
MPFHTASDGAQIFYKDWGTGQTVLFSHGWPLSADAWDAQMVFLGLAGYRVIAHDRRSHGRSSQTWDGNHMDQYADDLAGLIEALDLRDLILVGHSTGGGEITRYMGRHGTGRVAKAVLLGAVPPLMLQTEANPGGLPVSVFDGLREGTLADRSQVFLDLALPFYGMNRPGAAMAEGLRQEFWRQGMAGGLKAQLDCIREFSEVDFTADLQKIGVAVLAGHGDDDQIVPVGASALRTAGILKDAPLRLYPGGDHGLAQTRQAPVNADLPAVLTGE